MPKVSVIVPIYNVEEYLPKCFDSIKNQTFSDFEVLAVNDGSPDQSQRIIDQYAQEDKRFIPLIKKNGGLSDARNFAIPYVKGEFIFFLDSDDSLQLNALERLVEVAERENADLVICGYNEVSCNGKPTRVVVSDLRFETGSLQENPAILNELPHCAWNKLYKSELFTEKGIRYPKGLYYEDCGTSPIVYLESKRIAYTPDALINYLIDRPGNITTKVNRKILDVVEDLRIVNQYFLSNGKFDYFKNELCYFNLRLVFDNSWKLKYADDAEFVNDFLNQAYQHLDQWFPEWKNSSYFNGDGVKGILVDWMKKHPNIYKKYLLK